ncbi:hypothetical protein ACN38_g11273 [Penicillium nordicum]|uniref:Cysteine proteinase 1, mitochondrial n=1 Tax=Penicillium nordicum TaxID=229535 RepID=A0A0M8NSL9_9EURO|nr:hypothetical protein ACN38_g11273 [Penicillium nordicum]
MGATYSKPAPTNRKSEKTFAIRMGMTQRDQNMKEESSSTPPPPYLPRERLQTVTLPRMVDWSNTLLSDPKNRLAISSFADKSFAEILMNRNALSTDLHIFNLTVPIEGGPITNQRSTGRCWLFAATNIFRVPLMKAYNLPEFELSQAYLFYWDKIEKANYFYEQIIDTADQDFSGRLVQKLLEDPVTDGGQWDMVANLVDKYGLVPHTLYPDNFHAQSSGKMNWLLTAKLREQALVLRRLAIKETNGEAQLLAATKEQFLEEIHSLVTLLLGPPPKPDETFVWQYYDAKKTAREVQNTPKGLGQQALQAGSGSLFSLVHDPRHESNRLLTVERLGNVIEGRPLTYINVDMDTLKQGVISMLKAGRPVFFGCDVGKFYDRNRGVMDADLTDLKLGLNISLRMTKAERLASGETAMSHAMVITGVHLLPGDRPVRWRVENSWGEEAGDKGWFVMTDRWMEEYTFQAVIESQFLSADTRAVLRQTPKILPRWDPMGVLA